MTQRTGREAEGLISRLSIKKLGFPLYQEVCDFMRAAAGRPAAPPPAPLDAQTALTLLRLGAVLETMYTRDVFEKWLHGRAELFEGKSALELIQKGEAEEVLRLMGALEEGAYL